MCVRAFVFSYIRLLQASLLLFTSVTFFSHLGSCVALGHVINSCIKFPVTLHILGRRERLDRARSKGRWASLQQWPACPGCASSPHPCMQSFPFTFSAPFLVLLHHVHSSVNSLPSWQSLVYLTFLWMKWFWLYLWSPFLSFAGPHYFSYFLLEMDVNKTTHTIMMFCILNSFSRMILFIYFIQLHETGFLNRKVFVCCWFGLQLLWIQKTLETPSPVLQQPSVFSCVPFMLS